MNKYEAAKQLACGKYSLWNMSRGLFLYFAAPYHSPYLSNRHVATTLLTKFSFFLYILVFIYHHELPAEPQQNWFFFVFWVWGYYELWHYIIVNRICLLKRKMFSNWIIILYSCYTCNRPINQFLYYYCCLPTDECN